MSKSKVTFYDDISAFSGRKTECVHHLIFGNGLRELADKDCIYIPLTNAEHSMSNAGLTFQIHGNVAAEKLSKIAGQLAWERIWLANQLEQKSELEEESEQAWLEEARRQFIRRYGKSYL